jgi:shikimate dehydrogenase
MDEANLRHVSGKILEIAETLSLSGLHMNHYFKSRDWQAECIALAGRELQDLKTWLPYVQEGALWLRVPPEKSAVLLEHFPHVPTAVSWLETADSLVLEDNEWWPRLYLCDTLRNLIVNQFRDLDISLNSYVIGANKVGRAATVALVDLGFSHVSLVDEDSEKLDKEVKLLRRYLFGVNIEGVPAHSLTIQKKPGSLMLNAMQMQDNSTVLGDLSYFNFMKTGGVVVDISECTSYNRLLEEAERADLKILSGLAVQAQRDVDMLIKVFPKQYITYEDYLESFTDHLPSLTKSSVKNPSSV